MAEILKELGIEPGALVVNIASFVLLLWLMKRYMFGPVGEFIEQRKRLVAETLDSAEADRAAAASEREDIASKRAHLLQAAAEEAQEVKQQAGQEAEEIRRAARERARQMERLARSQIEREASQAAQELRNQTSEAAGAMARKLLQATLTQERHQALLDQFIADIEKLAEQQIAK